jgi:ubiquinone/menaquinone biosynthesis C-methylase UbiE
MTAALINAKPELASRLINGILAIKPLANIAKYQARNMMIKRAEKMGVPWRENARKMRALDWESERAKVENSQLSYPEYYLRSFHAYENGNLNWDAALEVESAAYAVHSTIWPGAGIEGDPKLRQSYHDILAAKLSLDPQNILDMGCGIGMSTLALQNIYPQANTTGLDLSPYFLAVAQYRSQECNAKIKWIHAAAESTHLANGTFDLVSAFLMFHELPQKETKEIFDESRRLLRPGGFFAFMDINPQSEIYKKMPPYILTLLKSTEPYLDQYFAFDVEKALLEAGFQQVSLTPTSPRHRAVIAC